MNHVKPNADVASHCKDAEQMVSVVEQSLYRQRRKGSKAGHGK